MLGIRSHEAQHLGDAILVDARRDVDQHQRGKQIGAAARVRLALGEKRRDAAERSADRDRLDARAAREFGRDRLGVGGEIRERIGAIRDPFRVAMAALVERIGRVALARDPCAVLVQACRVWPPPCSNSTGGPLSPNTSATSLLPAAPMKVAVAGVGCRVMTSRYESAAGYSSRPKAKTVPMAQ